MKDSNFLSAHNAKHLWHPMAHPAEMQANPPAIITAGEGCTIRDADGASMIDAVGGLWNVNLGYSCDVVTCCRIDNLEYSWLLVQFNTLDWLLELARNDPAS